MIAINQIKVSGSASLEIITAKDFYDNKARISLNAVYQRGSVWTTEQKQGLIDSILSENPQIPMIYVREAKIDKFGTIGFEAFDGKQRGEAIFGFFDDEFPIFIDDINTGERKKVLFSELKKYNAALQKKFEDSNIIIANHGTMTEENVRTGFYRLQHRPCRRWAW